MGIFSKRAAAILDVRLSNLDCDVTEQTLGDSRKDPASLAEFLRERKLITTDDTYTMERARERVEESGIVRVMLETCDLINKIAGRTIVDVHSFLPPIPILCCFIFVEQGTEYFIRLELQGTIPTLIFAERNDLIILQRESFWSIALPSTSLSTPFFMRAIRSSRRTKSGFLIEFATT